MQCGIDGAHMHYATLYTSKGTQQDDGLAYVQVAKTLYARFHHQEEGRNDPESLIEMVEAPTPQGEGIIHLISSVLSQMGAHVVSAPMAWYIMRK